MRSLFWTCLVNKVLFSTSMIFVPHHTNPYHVLWHGMVWSSMVWFGMVWYKLCGLVWSGVVWYGLSELCQRAAKAAIRDAIAADELKTDDMDVDETNEISRKHFEEAMAGARRSVAQTDLAKYDQFRQKMQPTYNLTGGGQTINWPDEAVIGGGGVR